MRLTAWLALGGLLWLAWRPAAPAAPARSVESARALPQALREATVAPVTRLDVTLDSLPGRSERAWARALASAGTAIHWRLAPGAKPGIALTVEPVSSPNGGGRVIVSAAAGEVVTLRDAAGSIDSATTGAGGVRVLEATIDGTVMAATRGAAASAALRDSVVLRKVLVLARAGWEGKFTVAALEEAGWEVAARFRVAPDVVVRQGGDAPIDTARYAAVVALDSSAAPLGAAITRFVRSGGGVVLGAEAARLASLAGIAPARAGQGVAPLLGALPTAAPRRALGGIAYTALRPAAVVLERTGASARVVAARVDGGRSLTIGYDDTWRWRMEGGDGAPADHRAWWSGLVASVAHAPLAPLAVVAATDEAPYPALVEALGEPAAGAASGAPPASRDAGERILFTILLAALLAEWGSRRLRGAR